MGIEPFSIYEWKWELIPIFSQWMGMGINSPKMMNGPRSAKNTKKKKIIAPRACVLMLAKKSVMSGKSADAKVAVLSRLLDSRE